MIDISSETLIPIKHIPKHLPHRPHISTVYRWVGTGNLEIVKIGGRVFCSVEALARFCEHRGGKRETTAAEPTPQRRRQIADAERTLRKAGI